MGSIPYPSPTKRRSLRASSREAVHQAQPSSLYADRGDPPQGLRPQGIAGGQSLAPPSVAILSCDTDVQDMPRDYIGP